MRFAKGCGRRACVSPLYVFALVESVFFVVIGFGGRLSHADTFMLKSGGKLEGTLVNADERPRTTWKIALASGGEIILPARSVSDMSRQSPAQQAYGEFLPKMPATAEGNLRMAQWCVTNKLSSNADFHYERVLSFDTDNEESRRALGYGRIDGKWVRPDDFMRSMGYVRHKNEWRLPMDVALEDKGTSNEILVKGWTKKLRMWHSWFGTRRDAEARENFAGLTDPAASVGLATLIKSEERPDLRRMLIATLGQTGGGGGVGLLADLATTDPNGIIRDDAIRVLREKKNPVVIAKLTNDLKANNVNTVNNAAIALSRLGATEAIPELIEALVTQQTVTTGGGGAGSGGTPMAVGFGSGGGGGLGVGGGPTTSVRPVAQVHVLDALMELSGHAGAGFNYNQDLWRQWYVHQKTPQVPVDLMRRRE